MKTRRLLITAALFLSALFFSPNLQAQDAMMGEVKMFAGNFAPRGWALCQGQLLSINEHQALFSLLGTTYGGDGRTTFALPDLRGRAAVGTGTGPGLTPKKLGQNYGQEQITLTVPNLPSHTHSSPGIPAYDINPDEDHTFEHGANSFISVGNEADNTIQVQPTPTGGNQPVSVVQPSAVINYIICLQGIFPSRN